MQDAHDLKLVLEAGTPLTVINSHDEPRVIQLLQSVARGQEKAFYQWTITDGLQQGGFGLQLADAAKYADPEELLVYLKGKASEGIYALCDFHHWLEDSPKIVRLVKDIALGNDHGRISLVLISHQLKLPAELTRLGTRFTLTLPDEQHIRGIIREEARKWHKRQNSKVLTNTQAMDRLVNNLTGLTHGEIARLVRTAIADDSAITEDDLPGINQSKFRLMDMEGVLSYEFQVSDFSQVGGMENLENWLDKRKSAFVAAESTGIDCPRGILLLGVQGGGKSLAAKAVAGQWGLPLLKLDMGALYNKYYGETEKNLRESLSLADRMSPCVMWVDEIEKALAEDESGGLSRRVLGTLLTWMAERKSRVFLVATSNDISRLPPELIRKGRMDELFFVDLPGEAARRQIFEIHLARRNMEMSSESLDRLVDASDGFVGAEIEQAIVSAVYSAMADEQPVTEDTVLGEIAATTPLSLVMAEKLATLRHWAAERQLPLV